MSNQPVAIDENLVTLGFASENRMIVEHEAGLARTSLPLKNQRRRQPADAPANNHAIIDLARLNRICGSVLKQAIANLMSCLEHRARVSIRVRVITHAAVTRPTGIRRALRKQLRRRYWI